MADFIGAAEVEIVPNLVGFETQLRAGIDRAMSNLKTSVASAMKTVEDQGRLSATRIGESFQKAGQVSSEALNKIGTGSFTKVQAEAEQTGVKVSEAVSKGAAGATAALDGIGGGSGAGFDKIAVEAERAGLAVSESIGKGASGAGAALDALSVGDPFLALQAEATTAAGTMEAGFRQAGVATAASIEEAMAIATEATRAYEASAAESRAAALVSIRAANKEAADSALIAGAAASKAAATGGAATAGLGAKLTKSLTVPTLAFVGASLFAAETVDKGYHIIEQRTGAVGDRLKGLKEDFDAVARNTGAKLPLVAEDMAQINAKLGVTGPALQSLTTQFLTLTRVAGDGAPTIGQVTTAMAAWTIKTKDQGTELDKLFRASQQGGVPLNELLGLVVKFAVPMRATGLSIEATAGFMGLLARSGVPVGRAMTGVISFLGKIQKSGGDAKGAFQALVGQAAGMYKVGNSTGAATLLVEKLGNKTGQVVFDMIKQGKLTGHTFDDMLKNSAAAEGAIKRTGDSTVTMSVKLNLLKNQALLALAPLGEKLLPAIVAALKAVIPPIVAIVSAFSSLPAGVQSGLAIFALLLAAIGPVLSILGLVVAAVKAAVIWTRVLGVAAGENSVIMGAWEAVMGLFVTETTAGAASATLMAGAVDGMVGPFAAATTATEGLDAALVANPIGLVVVAIAALIAGLVALYFNCKPVRDIIDQIGRFLRGTFLAALNGVRTALDFVRSHLVLVGAAAGFLLLPLVPLIAAIILIWKNFNTLVEAGKAVGRFFSDIPGHLSAAASAIAGWASGLVHTVVSFLTGLPAMAVRALVSLGPILLHALGAALNLAAHAIAQGVFLWLASFVALPILAVRAMIRFGPDLVQWARTALARLASFTLGALAAFIGFWVALPARIIGAMLQFGGLLLGWAQSGIAATVGFFTELPARLVAAAAGLGSTLAGWIATGFSTMAGGLTSAASSVFDWFVNLPANIIIAVGDIGSQMLTIGKDVLDGLVNGIENEAPRLIHDAISFVTDLIPGWAKSLLNIGSPSQVMFTIGTQTTDGLVGGLRSGAPGVSAAAQDLGNRLAQGTATVVGDASTAVNTATAHVVSDLQLMKDRAKDPGFRDALKKNNIDTVFQLGAIAHSAGIAVKDALTMDPKDVLAAADAVGKFAVATHDAIVTTGNLSAVPDNFIKFGQAGVKAYFSDVLKRTAQFTLDITEAAKRGLNPNAIADLITAGPEKAGPILSLLIQGTGNDFIKQYNAFSTVMEAQAAQAAEQARITKIAINAGQAGIRDMGKAQQISTLTGGGFGTPMTAQQLGDKLGIGAKAVKAIAAEFGLHLKPDLKAATAGAVPKLGPILGPDIKPSLALWGALGKGSQAQVAAYLGEINGITKLFGATQDKAGIARRDAAVRAWVSQRGGSNAQAAAMIAELNAKMGTSAADLAAKAAWIKQAFINRWAETHHVTVADATNMFATIKAKHGTAADSMEGRARTLEQNMVQAALDTKNGVVRNFSDLSTTSQAVLRASWVQATLDAKTGGTNIGEGIRAKLAEKAAEVSTTADEYAWNLAKSLNQVLGGVGMKQISVVVHGHGHTMARGGAIPGFGSADTFPAMLMPGEVVVRKTSVARAGVRNLLDLNEGRTPPGWHIPGFAAGGLASADVERTKAYGYAQVGKPYVWGAVGPSGFDCSGLASALVNVALGRNPNSRVFTSATLGSAGLSPGFGQISIGGYNSGGKGHVAATIGGVNFEATPPAVRAGSAARGADSSMFNVHVHLGSGDFISGGGGGGGFAVQMPKPPGMDEKLWLHHTASAAMQKMYEVAQAFSNAHTQQGGDPFSGGTGIGSVGIGPVTGGLIARIEATIKTLESGGNYSAHNPYSSAAGAYQFTSGTWGGFGGYPSANLAPPSVQDAKAAANIISILGRYGQVIEAVPAAWYTGSYRGHGNLNYRPPGAGNPLTVQAYVDRWMGIFAQTAPSLGGRGQPFARGGTVPGVGIGDSVPALLTPGEFVLTKQAAEAIGHATLHQWNRYGQGGVVTGPDWLEGLRTHPYAAHQVFWSGATLAAHKGAHSTLYTQFGPDDRGFNWRNLGDLQPTTDEAKYFPKGLVGDLNQDMHLTDREWKAWLVMRKILAGPHASDVDQFLQAVATAQAVRRRYFTKGFNWKRNSDGLSPVGHVAPDIKALFPNGLIGDLSQDHGIDSGEWRNWQNLIKFMGSPIEAARQELAKHRRNAPPTPTSTRWLTNDAYALLSIANAKRHGLSDARFRDQLRFFQGAGTGQQAFRGNLGADFFGYHVTPSGTYTRRVPSFHQGGMFRASEVGGTGLAWLKDRETVLPPGQAGGVSVTFAQGAIQINVTGDMSDAKARQVGESVGEGVATALRRRRLLADAARS